MKIRSLMNMDCGVYRIVLNTCDWSQGDIDLMEQFGEPEVDLGGEICYIPADGDDESSGGSDPVNTKVFGKEYVRVLHGFPYSRGFDSRDYGSVASAVSAGNAWKDSVCGKIRAAVVELRSNAVPLPTEEISEM